MAITVYPLNDIDFSAEDVAIYNATRTSGIYAGDDFAISLTGADNNISIDVGLAWMHLSRFNGVAVALKSKTFVDMGLPNAIYPRIDALVLKFDANQNGATLVAKQGAASSNPQPPAVSRTEALYELHLLHVLRTPGAAYISAGDVTDLRLNANYCGLMADAVTRVDTAAINAQVTTLIQKLRDDLADVEAQDYYASKDYVDAKLYPIGSIYLSVNSTSPASIWGGIWEQLKDRFLLGAGKYSAGDTGGESTHFLTTSEMPSHRHIVALDTAGNYVTSTYESKAVGYWAPGNTVSAAETGIAGESEGHNNMPPYLVVYMWKRVA